MMLIETMLAVGFSNCRDEYWHFSYGDSGWAVRVGERTCPYGIAELPADAFAMPTETERTTA
jgi:D-alanyl-D-alanine dipeptidase